MADPLAVAEPPAQLVSPSRLKTEPLERPQSPEANCAICLEDFNNKSYTDSCLHEFCFTCLKEWSKIKPECPLCKQRFQTIIHNVRSHHDYDEYHVEDADLSSIRIESTHSVLLNLAFQRGFPSLRYRALMEDSMYHMPTPLLYSLRSAPALVRAADTTEPAIRSRLINNPDLFSGRARNRRDIYRHNKWVRPAEGSRVRESSPEFYRLNIAQTHRLLPWLARELNVLLDVSVDPQAQAEEILRLITVFPIRSRQFRDAVRPLFGARTDHFIHEFYNFAISVYDMLSYDMVAEYDARPARYANVEPSDSDSDVEVVLLPFAKRESRQSQSTGLDLTNRAGPSSAPSQTSDPDVVIVISDTSSDDEVEIIDIRPATPETIVIDDESDAEVVIDDFSNQNYSGHCSVTEDAESSQRSECSSGSGCDAVRNILNNLDEELIDERLTNLSSPVENASRSPTPPMPYLRPICSKGTSSSSSRGSSSSPCLLTGPSSSSSSTCSSTSSDSNYSACLVSEKKKRSYYQIRRPTRSTTREKPKKRQRKSIVKIEESSSDEEYEPRSNRPRLRSVVVKPESTSSRRSSRNIQYIFPTDSD